MDSLTIFKRFTELKIIPVVTIERSLYSLELADALIEAGLPCAEITLRTNDAFTAIDKIACNRKEVLLGAGTVLKVDQVKEAIDMGAGFIVTPGFNQKVVEYCINNSITVIPGTSNPTDIGMALDYDLTLVKFFPAENYGGASTLRAMSAPYPMMRFIPTGGINIGNMMDYLALSSVIAIGGSWMVEKGLVNCGNFREITRLTKEAVNLVKG
ncbi:MAG: bifunctional 4-hydroxy-2-oxoglutarate aldolase/2-dehydro-3-deoxy-phosphogluconate aldolase [Desulfatiglans sp.]|nr:bifunctional 4-hydroxy-2-oxoglutarate aldolase/2-dehydro-3-deoxy-phosphogluconate aldolase [Desulfatiglans sp.]